MSNMVLKKYKSQIDRKTTYLLGQQRYKFVNSYGGWAHWKC